MDLSCFKGNVVLLDISAARALIRSYEERAPLILDDEVMLRAIFQMLQNIKTAEALQEPGVVEQVVWDYMDVEDIFWAFEEKEFECFREACYLIAVAMLQQLTDHKLYKEKTLGWFYRGNLNNRTAIFCQMGPELYECEL